MNTQSRRQAYAEATRQALLGAARQLFAERGYAQTSIDDIARSEQLTKGAFYHHFKHKQDIFEQVVDDLLASAAALVAQAAGAAAEPWERALAALDAFLDGCLDPVYQRIVIQEAPAVLGWSAWRERERRSGLALAAALLGELMELGLIERQPLELAAQLLLGAIMEAALAIAHAPNPAGTRAEARGLLERMIRAL
ncbi:MAG TPA: helix-turn-helix domain-containing protein [Herpetosiphonaceae bacterium]